MKLLSLETIRLGISNILLHKLRSLLTSLGIIFGVAAVICMLSISEGASADEMRLIQLLGTRNIIVNSVKPPQTGQAASGASNLIEYGITDEDISIIKTTLPGVADVIPLRTVAYRIRHGEYQAPYNVVGTSAELFDVVNVEIARGRPLAHEDIANGANVCVIGEGVRSVLFPVQDPIGETILADRFPSSIPFIVVGVLKPVQTAGSPERGVEERDLNREVLVPITTATGQFGETIRRQGAGSREFIKMAYSGLYVASETIEHVIPLSLMIQRVFEFGHRQSDYEIKVPLALLNLAKKKKRNNQLTLGLIAGISLLVGGIGIMNIMLATVTERTREIGIRRALGARQRHISVQFLVETVTLSTCGGGIGAVLGILSASFVSTLAGWQTIVSPWSVIVSFSLSVFVGIFFGMYPAVSAAKMDPIEALRHE